MEDEARRPSRMPYGFIRTSEDAPDGTGSTTQPIR